MRHIKLFEEFEDKTLKQLNELWDSYTQMVKNGDLDKDSSIAIDRLFETAIDYYTRRDQGKSMHNLGIIDLESELISVAEEIEKTPLPADISRGYYDIGVDMNHIIAEIIEICGRYI